MSTSPSKIASTANGWIFGSVIGIAFLSGQLHVERDLVLHARGDELVIDGGDGGLRVAGVFLDRWSRRNVIYAANLVRAVMVVPMTLLTWYGQEGVFGYAPAYAVSTATLADPTAAPWTEGCPWMQVQRMLRA